MIIAILEKINLLINLFFSPFDNFINKIPFDEWVSDAIIDSVHLIPFLFFIFVVIEILEFYFSKKVHSLIIHTKKRSIFIASLASIFPQCGFSVMASSLYTKKIITRGCLIAVYLGTSDECIPILLAHPDKIHLVIPVVLTKFFIAMVAGYFLDFILSKSKINNLNNDKQAICDSDELGCCHHSPETKNKRELILHPIFHTVNIFAFILVITLILNYLLEHLSLSEILFSQMNSVISCITSSLIGLIPNCAVSIALTMMLIKGHISFGAAMSGLLSNSGLGLIVLLKNNNLKDNLNIILTILAISAIAGILLDGIISVIKL